MQDKFKISLIWAFLALNSSACAANPLQGRSLAATCANCHGTHGIAQQGMESLAGKPKDYLLKALVDFKSGKRPATVMHHLAKGYTDEQLEQLANFFAAQKH